MAAQKHMAGTCTAWDGHVKTCTTFEIHVELQGEERRRYRTAMRRQ